MGICKIRYYRYYFFYYFRFYGASLKMMTHLIITFKTFKDELRLRAAV